MLRFAANLTMMFNEFDFLDRFEQAASAGFKGVEMLFPYDVPAADIARKLEEHNLESVILNLPPGDFEAVKAAIDEAAIPYIVAEVTMLPQNTTNLAGKEAEQMVRLMEFLDDCDDVQKVYTNADIPEEIVNRL